MGIHIAMTTHKTEEYAQSTHHSHEELDKTQDTQSKITLSELFDIARERYYKSKQKRHSGNFNSVRFVLIAMVLLNRPVFPREIEDFIMKNKDKPEFQGKYTVWKNIGDQVTYYLAELSKEEVDIVEKLDRSYYQLCYRVIPSPLELTYDLFRNHDSIDLPIVLALLKNAIDELVEAYQSLGGKL